MESMPALSSDGSTNSLWSRESQAESFTTLSSSPQTNHDGISAMRGALGALDKDNALGVNIIPASGMGTRTSGASPTDIQYRVRYETSKGRVVKVQRPRDPFRLSSISDAPVLEVVTTVTGSSPDDNAIEDDDEPTFMADKKINLEDQRITQTVLKIRSQELLNALRSVVKYYPGQTLLGDSVSFQEPFRLLVHHRAELEAYKFKHPKGHSEEYKKVCNEHIDILLNYLKNHFGKSLEIEERRHRQSPPVCTFEWAWLLLKPGDTIYAETDNKIPGPPIPYVVKSVTGGVTFEGPEAFNIGMWNVDSDGYMLGRSVAKGYIVPFVGEREITSLTAYPTRFHKDTPYDLQVSGGRSLEQRLIARGKKFWEFCKGFAYKEYEGITLEKPHRRVKSRIVIDFDSYYAMDSSEKPMFTSEYLSSVDGNDAANMASECTCSSCAAMSQKNAKALFSNYDCVDPNGELPNTDHFFFLCRCEVPAYILAERKWEWLDAEYVQDVRSQKDAFQSLVLPPDVKGVVEALSRTHIRSKTKQINTDFIKGKGEGRIFLLHGPPGVGKTCTAESVAEILERPMLALTCGDIGTSAKDVERNLDKYLTWGELWGAVVLLDEADIYLEKRAYSDVERNSVVSVFLRQLEYYRGLMFLTTNRVSSFDEAFKSRIHVSLHYQKLDQEGRITIWDNFFTRGRRDGIVVTGKARKFVREDPILERLEWNGREIRNAFQTAIALAQFEAEGKGIKEIKVTSKHMERVVNMAKAFSDYCFSINRGRNDSERAKDERIRNDYFGQPVKSKKSEIAARSAASKKQSKRYEVEEESTEEDSEEEEPKHKKKGNKTRVKKTNLRENSREEEEEEEESDDTDEDEEDEEMEKEVVRGKKKATKSKSKAKKLRRHREEDDDEDEDTSSTQEEKSTTKASGKKRSELKRREYDDEEDEEDEEDD